MFSNFWHSLIIDRKLYFLEYHIVIDMCYVLCALSYLQCLRLQSDVNNLTNLWVDGTQ